jgi:pyridoxine 4-dehydrogenase
MTFIAQQKYLPIFLIGLSCWSLSGYSLLLPSSSSSLSSHRCHLAVTPMLSHAKSGHDVNENSSTRNDYEDDKKKKKKKQQQNNHGLDNRRRQFLSNSVATATAAAAMSPPVTTMVARAAEDGVLVEISSTKITASSLELPEIGLGAWAWGDSVFWGYNPSQDQDLNQVFDYAVDRAILSPSTSSSSSGKLLLDSAELYGLGRSESLIGDFAKGLPPSVHDKVIVATKFAPLPFRTKPTAVLKACEASAKRLSLGLGSTSKAGVNSGEDETIRPIDLYQIHFPMAYENEAVWDGLAMAYERGLVKAVGVSNYGVDALRACHAALSKRGIPLATNQIQYSLAYRYAEHNGLLQACRDLGVKVLAYSPLALGLLTGKYTDSTSVQQKVKGPRKALFQKSVERPEFVNLIKTMEQVADNHPNANVPQVALNYCRAKGTIPIPGARNLKQIQSNFGCLDWKLSTDEINLLDKSSKGLSYINPDASPFPKVDKDTGLVMFDS